MAKAADLSGYLGGSYLLSIGVSKHHKGYTPLKYPAVDATAIHRFFSREAKPGFKNTTLLTSSDHSPGVANLSALREALHQLSRSAKNENDLVVIYVSSHGAIDVNEAGELKRYIVTEDSDYRNPAKSALPYEELIRSFRALPSKRKVLVLDFCHSGTGKSGISPGTLPELNKRKGDYFPDPLNDTIEGEFILAASEKREPALEDTRLGHGVYTHFLLKGFRQDLNGDGAVTITEAHSYARNQTDRYTGGRQTPTAIMHINGVDPIVVNGLKKRSYKKDGLAFLFSFGKGASDYRVKVDGRDYGHLGAGTGIPGGKVRLTLHNARQKTILDRVVTIDEGKEYSLDTFLGPVKEWSIDLGLRGNRFMDRHTRDHYAPSVQPGAALRIVRNQAWRIWDLGMEVTAYPAVNETIREEHDLSQTRTMFSAGLSVGGHDILHSLTLNRGSQTSFFWSAGPALLQLSRNRQERTETSTSPGLAAGAGLVTHVEPLNARLGVEGRFSYWNTLFADGPDLLPSLGMTFFLGADL